MKPTLKKLEEYFKKNESLKNAYSSRIKNAIDMALLRNPGLSLQELIKGLQKEGIATVLRQSDKGMIYGITYIDHQTKCVFNGSDLGKSYSAKMIQERCGATPPGQQPKDLSQSVQAKVNPLLMANSGSIGALADALLKDEYTGDSLPFDLKRRKRRKKRNIGNNQ